MYIYVHTYIYALMGLSAQTDEPHARESDSLCHGDSKRRDDDEGDEAISIDFPYFLWIYSRG